MGHGNHGTLTSSLASQVDHDDAYNADADDADADDADDDYDNAAHGTCPLIASQVNKIWTKFQRKNHKTIFCLIRKELNKN